MNLRYVHLAVGMITFSASIITFIKYDAPILAGLLFTYCLISFYRVKLSKHKG